MNPDPRPTPRIDLSIELLVMALLAFLPATFGAVDAWSEAAAVAIGAAITLLLVARALLRRGAGQRLSAWAWAPIVLFVAVVVIQLIPPPASLVQSI